MNAVAYYFQFTIPSIVIYLFLEHADRSQNLSGHEIPADKVSVEIENPKFLELQIQRREYGILCQSTAKTLNEALYCNSSYIYIFCLQNGKMLLHSFMCMNVVIIFIGRL